jgi:transglutaminase-like putative cysteine protease
MSVLDQFDGNAWSVGGGQRLAPFVPPVQIPGLTDADIPQSQVTTQVKVVGDFGFTQVPAPYPAVNMTGIANPTYDKRTLMVAAGDSNSHSRRGQTYTVNSAAVAPSANQLDTVPPATSASLENYREPPQNFPADVAETARKITAAAPTQFGKALALQNYFLSNFTYNTTIPEGDGNNAIETFLKNKVGFCQQFAGTMAAMARSLGIPAVVAVGFTPGAQQSDGSYLVTTHDAHSWPMLYFTGIGWVRFEPTPTIAGGRGEAPAYAQTAKQGTSSQVSAQQNSSAAAPHSSSSAAACAGKFAQLTAECNNQQSSGTGAVSRPFASWGPFGVAPRGFQRWFLTGSATEIAGKLLVLVLLLLATVPGLGRLARRRGRRKLVKQTERYLAKVAAGGIDATVAPPRRYRRENGEPASPMAAIALAAWAELHECADDLGYPWAESDTPRQTAARLSAAARFGDDASAAMGRVTTLTEQARYAHGSRYDQPMLRDLPRDLRTLRTALAEQASPADRIRAAILPASSLARLRERREQMTATLYRGPRRRGRDQEGDAES